MLKKTPTQIMILLFFLQCLSNCAHYPDVLPAANGTHQVKLKIEFKGEGAADAINQARDYCDDIYDQKPYVVSENTKYINKKMTEKEYIELKEATQIAQGVSGLAATFGNKKTKKAGKIGYGGASLARSVASYGYLYTLTFNCK